MPTAKCFGYFVELRIAMANAAVLRRVGIPCCGHPNHGTAGVGEPVGLVKPPKQIKNILHYILIFIFITTHHDPKDLKILVYGTSIRNIGASLCNRGPQAFNPVTKNLSE